MLRVGSNHCRTVISRVLCQLSYEALKYVKNYLGHIRLRSPPARGRCLRGDDFRCHAEASGRRLTASATDPDSEYPQGWPTGFKPAVTGATSQRVKTFRHGHTCGYSELVSHNRLELLSPGCKPGVLPLDQWEIGEARQIQTAISPLARRVLSRLSYGPVSGVSWQIRTAVS